jgi:hypothetical protein
MRLLQVVCTYIVLSPFILMGLIANLFLIGFSIASQMLMWSFKPTGEGSPLTVMASLDEFESFTEGYKNDHPNATKQEVVNAFVLSKRKGN